MNGQVVNGNIDTKRDEEAGKGTVKGSSIGDSNGGPLNEQAKLLPNLNVKQIQNNNAASQKQVDTIA